MILVIFSIMCKNTCIKMCATMDSPTKKKKKSVCHDIYSFLNDTKCILTISLVPVLAEHKYIFRESL